MAPLPRRARRAPPSQHHVPERAAVALQWPALLRPLSQLNELPAMVLERYSAVQTVCFCGVFPEIGRAWATVDNSLFLWRFDRWCARMPDPLGRPPPKKHATGPDSCGGS